MQFCVSKQFNVKIRLLLVARCNVLYDNLSQAHELVRSEILQQILNRVITKATTPVSHFIGEEGISLIIGSLLCYLSFGKIKESLI